MNGSLFDRPKCQSRALLVQLGLAVALFGSWNYCDSVRAIWDQIDQWVFFTLNGSLEGSHGWQMLWAFGNSRWCDLVSGIILSGILLHFMQAGGRQLLTERTALGLYIAIVLATASQIGNYMDDVPRESASLVLKPVHYLTELVPEIKSKDRSGNSFPGDHATVLWMVTIFFSYYAGRKYGLAAFAMALVFVLPRLFAGAHWFTDVMAGALPLALFTTAIAFYTPLDRWVVGGLMKLLALPPLQAALNLIPKCFGFLVKGSRD